MYVMYYNTVLILLYGQVLVPGILYWARVKTGGHCIPGTGTSIVRPIVSTWHKNVQIQGQALVLVQ